MKFFTILTFMTLLVGFTVSVEAKDCGPNCQTCYCTFQNGFMCDEDHPILGTCTCRCVKYKKNTNKGVSSGGELDDLALQEMINSFLKSKSFNYKIISAEFEESNPSGAENKGLFGKHWKCKIVPNGISCTGE